MNVYRLFRLRKPGNSRFSSILTRKYSQVKRGKEDDIDIPISAGVSSSQIQRQRELVARLNWDFINDPIERACLRENVERRQIPDLNVDKIVDLHVRIIKGNKSKVEDLDNLLVEASKIPNSTHDCSLRVTDPNGEVIGMHGSQLAKQDCHMDFMTFCKNKNLLRTADLGNLAGHRSYFLMGPLAELEQALIRFTVNELKKMNFQFISVPDILFPHVIDSCGFPTKSGRSQVYFLDDPSVPGSGCLSGTAEMAIGGFLQNQVLPKNTLPLKLASVSRCFRAETSELQSESGLYRVHYFTKVEMFGVSTNEGNNESDELLKEFLAVQHQLFKNYNFHFRTLEMPPEELGLSAHRKFDVEAWLPGKGMYGEISSCSNCTDFQSRRLNIRYESSEGLVKYAHTVNGTACAVPRLIISLVENGQTPAGQVEIPAALQEYMNRTWAVAAADPKIEYNFLRTKVQQDRWTTNYA